MVMIFEIRLDKSDGKILATAFMPPSPAKGTANSKLIKI
jgi:hypothetical protein